MKDFNNKFKEFQIKFESLSKQLSKNQKEILSQAESLASAIKSLQKPLVLEMPQLSKNYKEILSQVEASTSAIKSLQKPLVLEIPQLSKNYKEILSQVEASTSAIKSLQKPLVLEIPQLSKNYKEMLSQVEASTSAIKSLQKPLVLEIPQLSKNYEGILSQVEAVTSASVIKSLEKPLFSKLDLFSITSSVLSQVSQIPSNDEKIEVALHQFRINIKRARNLIVYYTLLKAQPTLVLDNILDVLRSALLFSVSALDYYIDEVVRLGMLEINRGTRPEPPAFSRFTISLGSARQGLNTPSNFDSLLEEEIRQRHSYKSFQNPDSIADAIRLISDKKLWQEVGNLMGKQARDVKQQLNMIVDRRNKVAHQVDIDPTLGLGNCSRIDKRFVSNAVDFIEQVVESIHAVL